MTTMTEHFMDELLADVEEQEELASEALCDLTLIEIRDLEAKIKHTFDQSEEEQTIIQNFALRRAAKFQDRINFLARKLEVFITERGDKTISLPHGILKIRKKQDKVEISDLGAFLENATPLMLNTVPESAKPDIAGIKAWMKMTGGKIPPGVKLIPGENEFSYKLNEDNTDGTKSETEA
jgi:hypothetical protein